MHSHANVLFIFFHTSFKLKTRINSQHSLEKETGYLPCKTHCTLPQNRSTYFSYFICEKKQHNLILSASYQNRLQINEPLQLDKFLQVACYNVF